MVDTLAESGQTGRGSKKTGGRLSRRDFLKLSGTAALAAAAGSVGKGILEDDFHGRKETYDEPLANSINRILNSKEFPGIELDADPQEWSNAIINGFIISGLPQTKENIGIVLTLIRVSSGFRPAPPVMGEIPIVSEEVLEPLKKQWTAGPMEVNYEYVGNLLGYSKEQIERKKDELINRINTVDEGVYFGISMLKDILEYYKDIPDERQRLSCVFADWNAGIGLSVRAGFIDTVSKLTGVSIRNTGRLLLKDEKTDRIPLVDAIVNNFHMEEGSVMSDLEKPTNEINNTNTWKFVEEKLGRKIAPVPADLEVPGALGQMKEILFKESSSKEYAENRVKEYQKISDLIKIDFPADSA